MNKITRIFLISMCAGVLLTGIGAGIAFGEYSSMEFREIEASESGQPVSSQSGFEVFMRYKDQVLDGLKNGYIYIHPGYYTGFAAQISVNPVDSERIHLL